MSTQPFVCARCGEELALEELRDAAHRLLMGRTEDGKQVAPWTRPPQVLHDYIDALEKHLESHP